MALLYEGLNQFASSDSLFTIIIASDEYNAMDMNDYAYIISQRESSTIEDLQFALTLAKKAIVLDPNNSMIMDTLGWVYFQLGETNLALKYLQSSIQISGDNSIILEHLGDVYLKMGKFKKAQDTYAKAIILSPTNAKLKSKLEFLHE